MKLTTCTLVVILIGLVAPAVGPALITAQAPPAPAGRGNQPPTTPPKIKNPLEGKPEAIASGEQTYRSQCVSCHGADAKGTASASGLTALWAEGADDLSIFRGIRAGIPNSIFPHSFGPDNTTWAVLAYLRSINPESVAARADGNPASGMRVFDANCRRCHQVNDVGGRLGPPLSAVGGLRSRSLLAQKIRHPSTYITVDYGGIENGYIKYSYFPVTLVTADGQRIRGVKKNEDTFSVQIMDTNENVRGYVKANLKEYTTDPTSLMPEFGADKLNDRDLQDLLTYLGTLRGSASVNR